LYSRISKLPWNRSTRCKPRDDRQLLALLENIDSGNIAEQGSHDELLAQKGLYCTLYMSQSGG
jgi:hypothetical protein